MEQKPRTIYLWFIILITTFFELAYLAAVSDFLMRNSVSIQSLIVLKIAAIIHLAIFVITLYQIFRITENALFWINVFGIISLISVQIFFSSQVAGDDWIGKTLVSHLVVIILWTIAHSYLKHHVEKVELEVETKIAHKYPDKF